MPFSVFINMGSSLYEVPLPYHAWTTFYLIAGTPHSDIYFRGTPLSSIDHDPSAAEKLG